MNVESDFESSLRYCPKCGEKEIVKRLGSFFYDKTTGEKTELGRIQCPNRRWYNTHSKNEWCVDLEPLKEIHVENHNEWKMARNGFIVGVLSTLFLVSLFCFPFWVWFIGFIVALTLGMFYLVHND